ncbi:MAG: hypothetical protein IPJ78_02165 [Gemmatimonadetes bacterium]|nr:hypothetical protein [Gemmatimonadota bacterium]
MFESLRATIGDLLGGRVAPADRRAVIADMKRALVQAKMGLDDLKEGVELTKRRVEVEREQFETASRRRTLAEGINDAETAAIAEKYGAQHQERLGVLERKLDVQLAELGLVERDYDEMLAQLKRADRGVGGGMAAGAHDRMMGGAGGVSDAELGLRNDAPLNSELDALGRARQRADREAGADAALEALKKKMGRE